MIGEEVRTIVRNKSEVTVVDVIRGAEMLGVFKRSNCWNLLMFWMRGVWKD